jgi:uncharacterized protein (TIGR03435 family)
MLTRRSDFWKLILLSVVVVLTASAGAQQPVPDSVKVREIAKTSVHGEEHTRIVFDGRHFQARNASVAMLLDYAYGVGVGTPLIGAPDWARSVKYDVDATVSSFAPGDQPAVLGQSAQPALIAVLQYEFHLTAHQEPRPGNGWALVVAKGKPQLKLIAETVHGTPGIQSGGLGVLVGNAATMDQLASALTSNGAMGSMPPVVNSTGLTGKYDFTLHWSPWLR